MSHQFPRLEQRVPGGTGHFEALEDKHELIAAGQAVAIGPPLDAATGLHPGLTTVPLRGVEPGQVALATRTGDRNRLFTSFRKIAEAVLTSAAQPPGRVDHPADPARA
ncbi:hypothetical protein GCM10022223_17480 [Kineosporia mesophila]|uniref:LysR substrate binding domain-containing protein n=1 Tax=Kineosporia mesophila TaxID=566012 RepID=A0ABP6ZBU7_9ACTN|nr:hypothetical protein [Kineosporia mesophila]MCD5352014.1 hypothetical protein [Kineosporia mesophila]